MLGSEFLGLPTLEAGLPSSELPRGGPACLPTVPSPARPQGGTCASASPCVKQMGTPRMCPGAQVCSQSCRCTVLTDPPHSWES